MIDRRSAGGRGDPGVERRLRHEGAAACRAGRHGEDRLRLLHALLRPARLRQGETE